MEKAAEGMAPTQVDRAGAICSTVCAVHCASTAAVPGLLAALGLGALMGPTFEWGFTVVSISLASVALFLGWRKHKVMWIAAVLAVGIAGLALGRTLEALEAHHAGVLLSISGGLTLVIGHIFSMRARRR